jgi:NADH-quinone oxidoreductase subunit J
MTPLQVIFWIVAAVTLLSGYMVVTRHNLVHAALFLVLTLFGVAVFFVLLEAGFLAVVQVLVYIGAIAIMMIFAVMLTRGVADEKTKAMNANAGLAVVVAFILFAGLVTMFYAWPPATFWATPPNVDTSGSLAQLGEMFVSSEGYIIPFEVSSILLLAALFGAVYVVWPREKGEGKS